MITCLIIVLIISIIALKLVDVLAVPTFLVFLVLKLCGVIAWSWWLVCTPLIVLVGGMILLAILTAIKTKLIID